MPSSVIVDLDGLERKKRDVLYYEKASAFAFCFGLVAIVAISLLQVWTVGEDIYIVLVDHPPDPGRYIRPAIFALGNTAVSLLVVYACLYMRRAVAQTRRRPLGGVAIVVAAAVLAFAYAVYAIPGLRQLYILMWDIYAAQWASILEVAVIVALCLVTGHGAYRSMWIWWGLSERDKMFIREDPESGFYKGRVLRTALGIPRIVDLMPRRRFTTMAEFVLAHFLFSSAIGWMFVYLMFFLSRVFIVDSDYGGDAATPYVAETAVPHLIYSLAAALLVLLLCPIVGGALLRLARSNVRWSVAQLLQADPRAPILFLRAFTDDQVRLPGVKLMPLGRLGGWLDAVKNLDWLLLEEGTPYGPVVAVGNPTDAFPPYGAARGYFEHKTWQTAVAGLAKEAMAIVICVDRTEGIWWEVEHIARLGYLTKTLFLIHPKDKNETDNFRLAGDVAKKLKPDSESAFRAWEHDISESRDANEGTFLGFFFDEAGVMHAGRSSTFSRLAYLIEVRWFFRSKFGFA